MALWIGTGDSPGATQAYCPHVITIREDDLALRGQPVQTSPASWRQFCDAVKRGEFDLDPDGFLPVLAGWPDPCGERPPRPAEAFDA
jgi:hypothetical protein